MRELTGDILRVYKLACYGILVPELAEDLWLKRLMRDNDTAFKARVWMTIVHRIANIENENDIDLATCFPRTAIC